MKYFYSIFFLITIATVAYSQEDGKKKPPAPVELKKIDTVKVNYWPTGLRVATDVISLVKSQTTNNKFKGWEVNADIDFYRYYLTLDYGHWARQLPVKTGSFENSGNYFRIGADVNFLLKDPDRNMVFLGLRYGNARFDHRSDYLNSTSFADTGVKAHWMELTGGLRVKIWKMLWMGFTSRFKFAPRAAGYTELQPYDIPGYGLFEKKIYWGFNYQVFIKIPVRKQSLVKSAPSK